MLRFYGRLTSDAEPPSSAAVKKDGTRAGRRSWMMSGMDAKHFDDSSQVRKGMWSGLDDGAREANERRLNDLPVSIKFRAEDPRTGRPVRSMKIGNDIIVAGADGWMSKIDGSALEIHQRLAEEAEAKTNDVVEKCLISDAIAADVLGMTSRTYERIMQGGFDPDTLPEGDALRARVKSWDIPKDVWAFEARTRYATLHDHQSGGFRKSVAKLRAVVNVVRPYIDNSGITEAALKDVRHEDADGPEPRE